MTPNIHTTSATLIQLRSIDLSSTHCERMLEQVSQVVVWVDLRRALCTRARTITHTYPYTCLSSTHCERMLEQVSQVDRTHTCDV